MISTASADSSSNNSGPNSFCSTALMIPNRDQTYTYISCGPRAETVTYLQSPTDRVAGAASASATPENPNGTVSMIFSQSPNTNIPTRSSGVATDTTSVLASTAESSGGNGGPTKYGPIIGGVLGGVMIFGLAGTAIFCIRRRRGRLVRRTDSVVGRKPSIVRANIGEMIHELPSHQTNHSELSGDTPQI